MISRYEHENTSKDISFKDKYQPISDFSISDLEDDENSIGCRKKYFTGSTNFGPSKKKERDKIRSPKSIFELISSLLSFGVLGLS